MVLWSLAPQCCTSGLNFTFKIEHSEQASSLTSILQHHYIRTVRLRGAIPKRCQAVLSIQGRNENEEQSGDQIGSRLLYPTKDVTASFLQGVKELYRILQLINEEIPKRSADSTAQVEFSGLSQDPRDISTSLTEETLKDSNEFQGLLKWMRRAFAVYKIGKKLEKHDLGAGNEHQNTLEFENNRTTTQPAFYILEEPSRKQFTLGIRGTNSFRNTVTDIQAWSSDFHNGHAHQGFIEASDYVLEHEKFKPVLAKLKDNKDYHLHITGHSYGAAVASLATVALLKDGKYSDYKLDGRVHCWGYACPPCLDMDLSRDPNTARSVTNVVNEVDLVTVATFLGWIGVLLKSRDMASYGNLERLWEVIEEDNEGRLLGESKEEIDWEVQVVGEVEEEINEVNVVEEVGGKVNEIKLLEEVERKVALMLKELEGSKVWRRYIQNKKSKDVVVADDEYNIPQPAVDALLSLRQVLSDASLSTDSDPFKELYVPGTLVLLSQEVVLKSDGSGEDVDFWLNELQKSNNPKLGYLARKVSLQTYKSSLSIFNYGGSAYCKGILEAMFQRSDV